MCLVYKFAEIVVKIVCLCLVDSLFWTAFSNSFYPEGNLLAGTPLVRRLGLLES